MARLAAIFTLLLPASASLAHEPSYEYDMLANTTQCAAFWMSDYAVSGVLEDDIFVETESPMTRAFGGIFRDIAIEYAEGDIAKVDYMIFAQMPYFTRLFGDMRRENPNPFAAQIVNDQARYCQNVGMFFGPERGFH